MYDDPIFVKALRKPQYAFKKLNRKVKHLFQDTARILSEKENSEIINQKEIRMVGLRRTGNHAIIRWIRRQQKGKFMHLNDIPINENPYRHEYEYFLDHYPEYPKHIEQRRQESLGNFLPKDCLIYNYEDYSLEKISQCGFWKKHNLYVGKSKKIYDLIILRDPFNLLASRIKRDFLYIKSSRRTFIELWIEYAKEFVGDTQYLTNEKVCFNYNKWFVNEDYRRELAQQLDLEFSDAGLHEVTGRGGGSSFDQRNFDGDARKMDLQGRWKNYVDNEMYRKLLDNEEIWEYSERIFGHIPGTEVLRKS